MGKMGGQGAGLKSGSTVPVAKPGLPGSSCKLSGCPKIGLIRLIRLIYS